MRVAAAAAVLALGAPIEAYYHYTFYTGRVAPFNAIHARFDVTALTGNTLNVFVSDAGPVNYAANDTFGSVLGEVKQAVAAWNTVPNAGMRLNFAGLESASQIPQPSSGAESTPAIGELGSKLSQAEASLNTDQHLADALGQAGNVVLPMQFVLGDPQGNPDKPLPDYVLRNQIAAVRDRIGAGEAGYLPPETVQATPPIALLGEKAAYIGHIASNPDADGTIRNELLLVHNDKAYYPSLALMRAWGNPVVTSSDTKAKCE